MLYLIALLFFIVAFLVIVAAYLAFSAVKTSPRHELKKRLRNLAMETSDRRFPSDLRVEILSEMKPIDRLLYSFGPVKRLHRLIDGAGKKYDIKTIIMISLILAILGGLVGYLLRPGILLPIVLALLLCSLPVYYFWYLREKRLKLFSEQFPDALDMVARSLQAGHSFGAAIQLVGNEMPEPTSSLFKTAYEEQSLGLSMREALEHMSRRMPSTDLKFFIMSTNIHRDIGGNLGEILERLAHTIRERIRIRRQVKVYTAQARLSGYILAVVPVAMAVFFYFSMPGYFEELFTVEWGKYALILAVIAQVSGFMVIRKITNIRI